MARICDVHFRHLHPAQSAHRPRRRTRTYHPGALPQGQEQSAARRRSRCRQDSFGVRTGCTHCPWRRARPPQTVAHIHDGHGNDDSRGAIPRRLREAHQTGDGRTHRRGPRHTLHRRDTQYGWGGPYGRRRFARCLQHAQALPRKRRDTLHRLYHLRRIQPLHSKPEVAGATLPADRHRRTVD